MRMTRRTWLGLLASVAAVTVASTPAATQQQAKKPNIVFMLMDNLGYGELGVYGGGILRGAPTPNIDRLASEGMRLLNFNVEAQCTPSRSAFMTGRFSIRSGTYEVPIGGVPDGLTQWEVTLPQLLSAQGYATGMWGKWHLGSAEARLPTNRGFDEWYGIPRTYDEAMWPSLTRERRNDLSRPVTADAGRRWSPNGCQARSLSLRLVLRGRWREAFHPQFAFG
jgi:arylsulfatase A-like enzyme